MKALSVRPISRTMAPNWYRIHCHGIVAPSSSSGEWSRSTASFIIRRSPPVEKPGPAPVRTIERTSGAPASSSVAASNWTISGAERTFRLSGSLSVTIARSPRRSTSTRRSSDALPSATTSA